MAVKIPDKLSHLSIEDLGLSVRSRNALKSHRIETFGQLIRVSDEELLGIYAFGKKCLREVRDVIGNVLSSSEMTGTLSSEAISIEREAGRNGIRSVKGWQIPSPFQDEMLDAPVDLLDLSARPTNVLSRLQISTIRQLLNYPKATFAESENIGRTSIAEIEAKLRAYLTVQSSTSMGQVDGIRESARPTEPTNLKQFVDQMLSLLSDRPRTILADRYGLWDGIDETLQDIGDKLGLTRERIRQIEAKGLKRIHRRYRHSPVENYVSSKIRLELQTKPESWGVISEDEAIATFGIGCTAGEVELAMEFLQDIACPGKHLFAFSLIENESGVYCVEGRISDQYRETLSHVELILRSHDKPLSEEHVIKEMSLQAGGVLSSEQLGLARRSLAISPKLAHLRNGSIVLSEWAEYGGLDAPSLAEAALRLLGRPAHFREITKTVNSLLPDREPYNEHTIHNSMIVDQNKFVRTKGGTYGLVKWGLKKPPYIKDCLIELLSTAAYPLPLWHLEEKVLEVCNCKRASIQMTLDLNPKLFTKFEGEQYRLRDDFAR